MFLHLHEHLINRLTLSLKKLTTFNPSDKKIVVNLVAKFT